MQGWLKSQMSCELYEHVTSVFESNFNEGETHQFTHVL